MFISNLITLDFNVESLRFSSNSQSLSIDFIGNGKLTLIGVDWIVLS